MKNKKKIIIAGALVLSVILASSVLFFSLNSKDKGTGGISGLLALGGKKSPAANHNLVSTNDTFSDRLVNQLIKFYGPTIADKGTQASMISIRDYIISTHPQNGMDYFYSILKRAFPKYADEIMETLAKLDWYNRWLVENKERLIKMTATERLAAMWKVRTDLFGKDAEKIWTGELLATEERKARMQDTLAELNESKDTTLDEKLDLYQSALNETYTRTPEAFFLDQGTMLAMVFFSIDSVQEELKKITPEQRQQEINRIRSKMGFTDDQVEKMARRDAVREQRWENGYGYMQQREAVVKQYEGQEREERLKELREEFFKDEANTIALEEKDGFFRFERPRIYGRN